MTSLLMINEIKTEYVGFNFATKNEFWISRMEPLCRYFIESMKVCTDTNTFSIKVPHILLLNKFKRSNSKYNKILLLLKLSFIILPIQHYRKFTDNSFPNPLANDCNVAIAGLQVPFSMWLILD